MDLTGLETQIRQAMADDTDCDWAEVEWSAIDGTPYAEMTNDGLDKAARIAAVQVQDIVRALIDLTREAKKAGDDCDHQIDGELVQAGMNALRAVGIEPFPEAQGQPCV